MALWRELTTALNVNTEEGLQVRTDVTGAETQPRRVLFAYGIQPIYLSDGRIKNTVVLDRRKINNWKIIIHKKKHRLSCGHEW